MNVPEYLKLAKKVLNEDAGSEGLVYQVSARSGLKAIDNDMLKINEIKSEDGISTAVVEFAYPQDYGFALSTIKENLEGIEIVSLSLIY